MTARNTEQRPQEVYNSYKGKVYGNILDMYDNPSYNLKLYIISPECKDDRFSPSQVDSSGESARQDIPAETQNPNSGPMGGFLHDRYTAPPENTVVLAQTGVTGNQIDNLEIQSKIGNGNGETIKTTASFTITQVGHVNFYDQIYAAKARLGIPVTVHNYPIFLEISFKGYTLNIDDPDVNSGEMITIGKPYIYRMELIKMDLSVDENGSKYDCEAVFVDMASSYTAVVDDFMRLPKDLSPSGSTIQEFATQIEDGLREYREDQQTDYEVKDEVKIVVDKLFDNSRGEGENRLYLKSGDLEISSKGLEAVNRLLNASIEDETAEEHRQRVNNPSGGFISGATNAVTGFVTKSVGKIDRIINRDKIKFKKGTNLFRVFLVLLSMNDEFYENITRKNISGDPTSSDVDKGKPLLWWLKFNSTLEYISFDEKSNRYAKRVTYYPELYHLSGVTIQEDTEENKNTSDDDNERRFRALLILKSYDYIFTGINDQVKNCNIEHNPGLAILLAPAGGAARNREVSQAAVLTPAIEEGVNLEDAQTAAARRVEKERKEENDLVNDLVSSAREETLEKYADKFGFNQAEIKDIIANRAGESAMQLKSVLANRKITQERIRSEDFVGPPTESDAKRRAEENTVYTNTPSGTLYSTDVLSETDLPALLEENAIRAAKIRAEREEENASENDKNKKLPDVHVAAFVNSSNSSGGDAESTQTTDSTTKHSVLGQIADNHLLSEASFLIKINMNIKGDPWWLGQPDKYLNLPNDDIPDLSTPDGIVYEKDQNNILFTFQSPRLFDFDVNDEDNNTGYWKPEGTSYFVSGVYFPISVNHSFSGGVFEQEIELIKNHNIRLSTLDKVPIETNEEE